MGKTGSIQDARLIPIGNSRGVRIPKILLEKYGFTEELILEETDRGILIRKPEDDMQLSWAETFKEMAQEDEDWGDFDVALTDGLGEDDT